MVVDIKWHRHTNHMCMSLYRRQPLIVETYTAICADMCVIYIITPVVDDILFI